MIEKELATKIDEYATMIESEVITIRRELHKIPEIGDDLPKTRQLILSTLARYDVEVKENVGNNGIVAILKGSQLGKTVAYRADMDALSISEENQIEYQSRHGGKMHACGHDGHVAIALGILKVLYKIRNKIHGNVKFIFQPAEETSGGALQMINDGVLDNPQVDYILGSHIWPSIDSGKFGLKKGPIMAGTDIIEINIRGKGGHAGIPHHAINPIVVGAKIIDTIETIKNHFISSNENTVISICSMHGGEINNVIPHEARILGTVRTFSQHTQEIIIEKLEKIIDNISDIYGAKCELKYQKHFPPTINNDDVIVEIEELLIEYGMQEKIFRIDVPSMGAEDFSYFLQKVPGAYIYLGTRNEAKGIVNEIHHPQFNIDEDIFFNATATLSKLIMEFLQN